MPQDSFLNGSRRHGALLLAFFGPLEVLAAVVAITAAALAASDGSARRPWLALWALLALGVRALFPLYFRGVKALFSPGRSPRTT